MGTIDPDVEQLVRRVITRVPGDPSKDAARVRDAEAGRAAAEQQFDALFLSSPLATALVGLDGTLVRVNESFAIVLGYDRDVLEGKTFQEITHPGDVSADEDLLAEVMTGVRQNYQMEKRYIHAAGHEIWVDLTVAPVRGPDGTVRNFVAHVEDITTRSMADRRRVRCRLVSRWCSKARRLGNAVRWSCVAQYVMRSRSRYLSAIDRVVMSSTWATKFRTVPSGPRTGATVRSTQISCPAAWM